MGARPLNSIPFIFILLLSGCVGTAQRLSAIDSALTEIQAGRAEQGRAALEKMCSEGWSGPCALLGKPAESHSPVPIMQGVTSGEQSRFAILTPGKDKLTYYVRWEGGLERLTAEYFSSPGSPGGLDQIEAFHLDPKVKYELLVIGAQAQLWDKRSFRALDLNKRRARLAIASCMDDRYTSEQAKIWPQLLRQKPDAILMIGDNVYVDRGAFTGGAVNPEFIWLRYRQTRSTLAVFRADPLVPVFAVWDDHDFGKNDGDRTFAYKNESAEVFYTYFPQRKPGPGFERGPGVSSWWTAFGVHVALLDDRSFRSPDHLDVPDQTHFGPEQEKWLQDHLDASREPVLVVSGDQFFGGYHKFESYEGNQPVSFKQRLEEWKKVKVPLVFVSGDRHLTEILKVPKEALGYPTFELTSSAIHAKVYPNAFKKDPSPNQLAGADGVFNYLIMEIMRADHGFLQVDAQSFTLGEKQLYQKTLTVKH